MSILEFSMVFGVTTAICVHVSWLVARHTRIPSFVRFHNDEGLPGIWLSDKAGKLRIGLALTEDNEPILKLTNEDGTRRLIMKVDEEGHSHLKLFNRNSDVAIWLTGSIRYVVSHPPWALKTT